MVNSQVATNIKCLIKKGGYKQYAIADRADIDRKKFNDMLNGRRIIRTENIVPIANALCVTPNELFKTANIA